MLAAATSLFGKSSSLSAYTLNSAAPSPSSSSTNLPSNSSSAAQTGPSQSKPLNVGLWKVLGATHKTTGKDVSVWVFEKRILEAARGDSTFRTTAEAREYVMEQLKKEVSLRLLSLATDSLNIQSSREMPGRLVVPLKTSQHPAHGRTARRFSHGIDIRHGDSHRFSRDCPLNRCRTIQTSGSQTTRSGKCRKRRLGRGGNTEGHVADRKGVELLAPTS